jgi:nucleoid-associated protein YgaU
MLMSDPFAPESNHKVIREAQASLSLIAILLIVFVYVTYYRMTGQGSRVPEHVLRAPVSKSIWTEPSDRQGSVERYNSSRFAERESSNGSDFKTAGAMSAESSAPNRLGAQTARGQRMDVRSSLSGARSSSSSLAANAQPLSNRGQQHPLDATGPHFDSPPPMQASASSSDLIAGNAAMLNRKITDSLAAMDKIQASLNRSLESRNADADQKGRKRNLRPQVERPVQRPASLLAQSPVKTTTPQLNNFDPSKLMESKSASLDNLKSINSKSISSKSISSKSISSKSISSGQPLETTFASIGQPKKLRPKQSQSKRIRVVDDADANLTRQASTFGAPQPKLNAPRPILPKANTSSSLTKQPLHFNGLRSTEDSSSLSSHTSAPTRSQTMAIRVDDPESAKPVSRTQPRADANLDANSFEAALASNAGVSNDFVGSAIQDSPVKNSAPVSELPKNNQVESFYQLPTTNPKRSGSAPMSVNVVAETTANIELPGTNLPGTNLPKADLLTAPAQAVQQVDLSVDADSSPQLLSNSRQHIVQHGDSFWTIAQVRYGDGRYFRALYKYNELTVASFDRLDVGTPIDTPDRQDLARLYPKLCPQPEQPLNRESSESVGLESGNQLRSDQGPSGVRFVSRPTRFERQAPQYYVTQDGDTLFEIARQRLGQASRFSEIYESNAEQLHHDVGHLTQLRAGIKLKLPSASPR